MSQSEVLGPPQTEVDDDEAFFEGQGRNLTGPVRHIVGGLALVFALYQLGTALFGAPSVVPHRAIHLAFALGLCFLLYPFYRRPDRNLPGITDILLVVGALGATSYAAINGERIVTLGPGAGRETEIVLGVVLTLIALEAARRTIGVAMPIIAILLMVYAYFGELFPGVWAHRSIDIPTMARTLYFSDRGLFGGITGLSAGVISAFLIFGAILYRTGGGKTFVDIARLLLGRTHGGSAKVSTLSSALFGTVSGSAVANVIVDGVFNIPLMRRAGYRREFAAAVEAASSSGGQIVPPFMGAAAFVLAEFVGRPYGVVALAAAIPAGLYYVGLLMSIHFHSRRHGYAPIPRELIPNAGSVARQAFRLAIPVGVLIFLMTRGTTPQFAVAIATVVAVLVFLAGSRSWKQLVDGMRTVAAALIDGARAIVTLAALIAVAQIAILMFDVTGLGIKVSGLITSVAGTSLLLALILAMVTSVILGMGVPTTAAYVIGAAVVVPALISLNVDPLAAHMFVLYFAVISAITPPVCPAVYAAASLARARWFPTAVIAVGLAFSGFLVPFLFAFDPALLMQADLIEVVHRVLLAVVGVVALSAGFMGYLLMPIGLVERVVLVGTGMLLVSPNLVTDAIGLAIGMLLVASQVVRKRARHDKQESISA